jgi:hypothetical protein
MDMGFYCSENCVLLKENRWIVDGKRLRWGRSAAYGTTSEREVRNISNPDFVNPMAVRLTKKSAANRIGWQPSHPIFFSC